jgi:hypothetical protein
VSSRLAHNSKNFVHFAVDTLAESPSVCKIHYSWIGKEANDINPSLELLDLIDVSEDYSASESSSDNGIKDACGEERTTSALTDESPPGVNYSQCTAASTVVTYSSEISEVSVAEYVVNEALPHRVAKCSKSGGHILYFNKFLSPSEMKYICKYRGITKDNL